MINLRLYRASLLLVPIAVIAAMFSLQSVPGGRGAPSGADPRFLWIDPTSSRRMIAGVDQYFHSGDRVCLVGLVALGAARDTFAETVDDYFARWQAALAQLLRRSGLSKGQAQRRAEDALLTIQGALVLARARNDAGIFRRALSDLTARLLAGVSP